MIDALPATGEYVDRYDDTSAVILQDYALAALQAPQEAVDAGTIQARAAAVLCEAGALCGWPAPNCNAREGAEALFKAGLLATALSQPVATPAPSQDAAVDGEPTAFLIERLAGDGYGSPRSIVDAAKYDPRRDDFWVGDAKTRHLVTPLYAVTRFADCDGVEVSGNRAATFTYEDDEHAGPLYYFTPAIRPSGPYRQQRHVNAVVDIAADGSFAGVELIDNIPPLAPPASALKGGE